MVSHDCLQVIFMLICEQKEDDYSFTGKSIIFEPNRSVWMHSFQLRRFGVRDGHQSRTLHSSDIAFVFGKRGCHCCQKQTRVEHYELFDQKHGSARFTSFCTCGAKRTEIDIHWLSREWLFLGLFNAVLCKTVYSFQNISTAASIQNIVVLTLDS